MPEMDGLQLARAIRARPEHVGLPLVILSSMNDLSLKQEASRLEVGAVLRKPIRQQPLYATLKRLIHGGALAMELPPQAALDPAMGQKLPLHILIVDDDSVNQKVALLLLSQLGYGADVVSSGLQALQSASMTAYDAILMDLQMPEMDGLEATRRLRASIPRARQPYIIAVSADVLTTTQESCRAAGMDKFIAKPVQIHALIAALEEAAACRRDGAAVAGPAVLSDGSGVDSIVDPAAISRLLSLADGDMELFAQVLSDHLANSALLMKQLDNALARRDWAALQRAARSLGEAASQFGTLELAGLCREAEQAAHGSSSRGLLSM